MPRASKNRVERDPVPAAPRLVIITGLSGSGISSATKAFEDLHYFCVDNLPLTMLATFARLMLPNEEEVTAIEKAALVINIRERHFLSEFPSQLEGLKRKLDTFVVFFEASDDVLQRRFSETRRPHPADKGRGLLAAIRAEKRALKDVRKLADLIVDTSEHNVHSLRQFIIQRFGAATGGTPFKVQIVSFGHKYGNPLDLDMMFDVRYLPNPYFVSGLRELTGDDARIVEYLDQQDEVRESVEKYSDLLGYLLPLYRREGKAYLTVGIGCTGGRHRSVMIANRLTEILRRQGYDVSVLHRDVQK
ncbi:MAG: RNase adapter RapZ [Pyrinomonadaceae bacterium]